MLPISCPPLTIRDWRLHDLAPYRRWLQPGQRWQSLDGPYYRTSTSHAKIDAKVDALRDQIDLGEWPTPRDRMPIAYDATDTLIGLVSWYWISEETSWPAVGIVLFDPAHWGQGLGYTALGHWCAYVFSALPQIVRLDIQTWSGNHGMMRLAAKLGFREEARFRKARIVDGAYYDAMGYGILREEWDARHAGEFGVDR